MPETEADFEERVCLLRRLLSVMEFPWWLDRPHSLKEHPEAEAIQEWMEADRFRQTES